MGKHKAIRRFLGIFLAVVMVFTLCIPIPVAASTKKSHATTEIQVGESTKLRAYGYSWRTTWKSSDENIVTVKNDGTITGINPGEATVTASLRTFGSIFTGRERTEEFNIVVVENDTPESETIEVNVGETVSLDKPSNGRTTWRSSDTSVATVSSSGTVTGISAGNATITATTRTGGFHFWFIHWGGKTTTTKFNVTVVDNGETPEPTPTATPEPTVTPEPNQYVVTFVTNSNCVIENQIIPEGQRAERPDDPTKEGYTFEGWYSDYTLTSEYDFSTIITNDITIYAKWKDVKDDTQDPTEYPPVSDLDEEDPDVEIYSFSANVFDILIGETQTVTFTAEIFANIDLSAAEIKVIADDGTVIGYMHDDGLNGDETVSDGVYSLQVELYSEQVKYVNYYASVNDTISREFGINYYRVFEESEIEQANNIAAELNSIVQPYLNEESFIPEEQIGTVITLLSNYLNSQLASENIQSFEISNTSISIVLATGYPFSYVLNVDGYDAGTGTVQISTFQPFKGTYSSYTQGLSDAATDESAEGIVNTFEEYTFSNNVDSEAVTLDALKEMSNSKVVLWHGHGGLNSIAGSFLGTGEILNSQTTSEYSSDISAFRVLTTYSAAGKKTYCVSGGFFQKYLSNMSDAFVYLGACDSGEDMAQRDNYRYCLAQAFLDKGASAVIGNSATIKSNYNCEMIRDTMAKMMEYSEDNNGYYTLSEALNYAFEENGEDDGSENQAHPIIFNQSGGHESNYTLNIHSGVMSGKVINAANNNPISNVLVRVYKDDTLVASARTGSQGEYTFSSLATGDYIVKFSAGLYKSVRLAVSVVDGQTTYNATTMLMQVLGLTGGLANGIISNAITNEGIDNVTIKMRKNWNNQTGEVIYTTTTNENGYYSIDYSPGSYTIELSKEGFITSYKTILIGVVSFASQDATLTPVGGENVYRVVLTWGENPRDLDSHVVGTKSDGNSFHVYYSHKSEYDGDVEVCNLDVDDTSSYGPETITLNTTTSEPYYYYIYKFAGSGTVGTSNAQINVYKGSELVRTFNVPTDQGDGNYWNVFAIVNGEIVVKNTISNSADISYAGVSNNSVDSLSMEIEQETVFGDKSAPAEENVEVESQEPTEAEVIEEEGSNDQVTEEETNVESSNPEETVETESEAEENIPTEQETPDSANEDVNTNLETDMQEAA